MDTLLDALGTILFHSLVMIVGLLCVGAMIDWLTGGKILRRPSHTSWLKDTMDQHKKLLEEQEEIEKKWQEIEKEIQERTRKQP